MKFVLPMVILATLVSCSEGGSGKSNPSRSLSHLNTELGLVRRGMVVQEHQLGQGFHIEFGETNNSVVIKPVNEVSEKILIAIRGNKLYFYESDKYGNNVEVETIPTQSEIQEAIRTPGNQVIGSRLIINQPGEPQTDTYGEGASAMTVTANLSVNGSVNMKDLYCDKIFVVKHSNIQVIRNGGTQHLADTTLTNTTTCNGIKTVAQLKEIDLRDVSICDGEDCKDHENVSYLTSDLE